MQFLAGSAIGTGLVAWESSAQPAERLDQLIQKYRTAEMEIQLVNGVGEPIAHVPVEIKHVRHLFQFGCAYHQHLAVRTDETEYDRRFRRYFLQLCNAATVTFYWGGYEPQPQQYQAPALLEKIRWLKERNFYLRGHPLFWNHNPGCLPSWLIPNGYTTTERLLPLLDRWLAHLSEVIFPHLQDVDVFNELTWWYRQDHPLTPVFAGDQKIPLATRYFQEFHRLNPQVLATINDYVPHPDYPQLIRQLLANSAPIQAIGQQTHMHLGDWSPAMIQAILDRLSEFQKPIIFTEVSVLSADPIPNMNFTGNYPDWLSTPAGEQRQMAYLVNFYKTLFAHPLVTGIYQWSFSDRSAWLSAPTGLLNREHEPKPAYHALDRLINQEWRTSGRFTSDAQGKIRIPHAFLGVYQLQYGRQSLALGIHSKEEPLRRKVTLVP